jgi:hypothetical protein
VRFVVGFFRFWWDFIVGDDWRIAVGVVSVLGCGALLVAYTDLSDTDVSLFVGGGIIAVGAAGIVAGAIGAGRRR